MRWGWNPDISSAEDPWTLTFGVLLKRGLFHFTGHKKSGMWMHVMCCSPSRFNPAKSDLRFLEPKRKMISFTYDRIDSSYLHLKDQCLKVCLLLDIRPHFQWKPQSRTGFPPESRAAPLCGKVTPARLPTRRHLLPALQKRFIPFLFQSTFYITTSLNLGSGYPTNIPKALSTYLK